MTWPPPTMATGDIPSSKLALSFRSGRNFAARRFASMNLASIMVIVLLMRDLFLFCQTRTSVRFGTPCSSTWTPRCIYPNNSLLIPSKEGGIAMNIK